MTRETNIAAQEAFGAAVNGGDLAALHALVAPDSVDHDPAPGQGPGPQGFRDMFGELRIAFPDLHIEVEHLTATDDDVAFAYTVTGTQQGPLMGRRDRQGHSHARCADRPLRDGLLVERWGSSDQLGMLAQLGITPPN